jgi:integral membrane protein
VTPRIAPADLVADHARVRDLLTMLRLLVLVEAWSYLLLVAVAMPLKYLAATPGPVKVLGMAHGVLFLLSTWLLVSAHIQRSWPLGRVVLLSVASLVPVWPFLLDRRLKHWIATTPPAAA